MLVKASGTQAAVLHQQLMVTLPTPLWTAFAHAGRSMFSKVPHPFKKTHIQTQPHSHAFGGQHYLIQNWSKPVLKILSDTIVLYWCTIYSNALRNRLILFYRRLQVRENMSLHLQKAEHRSLMFCFTLLRLQTCDLSDQDLGTRAAVKKYEL